MTRPDIETVATKLHDALQSEAWHVTTGFGESENGATLFVYVKAYKGQVGPLTKGEDNSLSFEGYPVVIRDIGSVKAA